MSERGVGARDAAGLPKVTAQAAVRARRRSTQDLVFALSRGALIGGIAIGLGWGVTELSGVASASTLFGVAVYVAMLGAIYGLVTSSWSDFADGVWGRGFERAAIGAWVGLVGGAVAGAMAFVLYDNLQAITADPSGVRFYLLRVLAWAIFGAGIGAAPGLAERATRKIGNGVLGGVIGGALGGAVLHWASFQFAAERDARLLGLVAIGVAIGSATVIVELARRRAWLRVIAGGMAGKEFELYHPETDIGSSPKAQITLIKDPSAASMHARIVQVAQTRTLYQVEAAVRVNGQPIAERRLRDGDVIEIGSTTLEYAEIEDDS